MDIFGCPVDLDFDCYVHPKNTNLYLTKLLGLTALRVCLTHNAMFDPHDKPPGPDFPGQDPSAGLAQIISANQKLKHLHLGAPQIHRSNAQPKYSELQEQALELLGAKVSCLPSLTSLALMGELNFNDGAWRSWNPIFHSLRSLCISGVSLIHQIADRLQGELEHLQTLKLHIPRGDLQERNCILEPGTVRAFLSGRKLTHLSILGLRPHRLPEVVQKYGENLRTLHCHMIEYVLYRTFRPITMLSTANVQALQVACPRLEYLTIDFTESDLPPIEELIFPSKSGCAPAVTGLTRERDTAAAAATDSRFLCTLATMLRLQHLRLFVHPIHHESYPVQLISKEVVIATYACLQRHKLGLPIAKLEVYQVGAHPWLVQELGSRRMVIMYYEERKTRDMTQFWEVREVWDLESRIMRTREEIRKELQPVHGAGEAWELF